MSPEAPTGVPAEEPVRYPPGMDERSTRVAELLNTPLLIAAALTLPMVAITESETGGWLETLAHVLNWVTWLAFAVELVVMLAVVPDRRAWLRRNPLDLIKTRLQAGPSAQNVEATSPATTGGAVAAPRGFKGQFENAGTLVRGESLSSTR